MLILDEPTSQVDTESQTQVLDHIFKEARSSKTTVLMIAHKLESAVRHCDKILVMDQGSVKEYNTASNLLRESGDSPTSQFA